MTDRSHLNALELRLSHERERLRAARTEQEAELRRVWVSKIEREIEAERRFLGLPADDCPSTMTDADLLAALEA